jgi:hypothetical protein
MNRRGYNRIVKLFHFAAALAFVLSACGGNVHNTEAIRQSIVDHLSSRKNLDLDMSAMDLQVTSVAFRENEADATVAFKPKGSAGPALMSMRYTLERKGNQLVVKNKSEAGASPHGAGGAGPQESAPGQLPPGHPPVQQPPPPPPPK